MKRRIAVCKGCDARYSARDLRILLFADQTVRTLRCDDCERILVVRAATPSGLAWRARIELETEP